MHLVSLLSYTTILGGVVAVPAGSIDLTATTPVKRADSIHIVYCTPLPGEGSNSIPPFSAAVVYIAFPCVLNPPSFCWSADCLCSFCSIVRMITPVSCLLAITYAKSTLRN